jgi:ribosomal protein S18 acetylase RimI-like enzyme
VDADIRPVGADEYDEAAAMLSRAFWPDPLLGYFSRGRLHEHRFGPRFFSVDLADLRRYAEITVAEHDGRLGALAAWAPPGSLPLTGWSRARRDLLAAQVLLRARHRTKATRLLATVERKHPHEPHWYLALLGTDPAATGRGLATALLAPVLARCDEKGDFAYLETQKEANVAWYARAGFTVCDEIRLEATPPVWCLRRDPQG